MLIHTHIFLDTHFQIKLLVRFGVPWLYFGRCGNCANPEGCTSRLSSNGLVLYLLTVVRIYIWLVPQQRRWSKRKWKKTFCKSTRLLRCKLRNQASKKGGGLGVEVVVELHVFPNNQQQLRGAVSDRKGKRISGARSGSTFTHQRFFRESMPHFWMGIYPSLDFCSE